MQCDILTEEDPATLDDITVVEKRKNADRLYNSAYNFLECVTNGIKTNEKLSIDEGIKLITEIVDMDMYDLDVLHGRSMQLGDVSENTISHSVNIAIYSILLGTGLGYSREQLVQLGTVALLHDIGMLFTSECIIDESEAQEENELNIIRMHPSYTCKMLQNIDDKYSWIAEVACHPHERESGQRSPNKFNKCEIEDYAEIIDIVDAYEVLTHPRPQRNYYTPCDAAKLLVAIHKDRFSEQLKNLVITRLPCFPVGSYVRLNSNEIGRVLKNHEYSQTHPIIELLVDSDGRRLSNSMIVNLAHISFLKITDTFFEYDQS